MVRGSLAETAGVLGRPRRALLLAALRLPTRRFPLLLKLAWKCLCYECVGAGNASLGTATTPESAVPGWAMAIHALVPARTCRAASPAPPSSSQHFSVGGSRRTRHTRNLPCPAHPSAAVPPWKLLSLSPLFIQGTSPARGSAWRGVYFCLSLLAGRDDILLYSSQAGKGSSRCENRPLPWWVQL